MAATIVAKLNYPEKAFVAINSRPIGPAVSKEQFDLLWKECAPSSYGVKKGECRERLMDPGIRNSRETSQIMFDAQFLSDLYDMAIDEMESRRQMDELDDYQKKTRDKTRDKYAFRFRKCLLYSQDGCFEEHVDQQRHPLMTHTLIYNIPTEDTGHYQFTVEKPHELHTNESSMVIFPHDAVHSMRMVSGYRVCLVFDVIERFESGSRMYRWHFSNTLAICED